MKKLLVSIFAVVLLAGCGSSGDESKTCTMSNDEMEMSAKFDATDDEITKATIEMTADKTDMLGDIDISTSTKEEKEFLSKMLGSSLGIKEGEGVELSAEISDNDIIISVVIDFKDADASVLEIFGLDGSEDMSLSSTVKGAEEDGATCK